MSRIDKENLCKSMDELCMRIKITRDEIEERKLMVINTKEALENLFHDNNKGLLKQDTRRALQIEVNQKRRVYVSKYSFANVTRSALVTFDDKYTKDNYTIVSGKSIKDTKNYTCQYVTVKTSTFAKEEFAILLNRRLYLITADKKQPICCIKEKDGYRCLNNNKLLISEEIKSLLKEYNTNIRIYTPLFTTPAGDKGCSITFKLFTPEFRSEADLSNMYNVLLCGGFDEICEKANQMINKELSLDEIRKYILKAITRFSAKQAPSVSLGLVEGIALLNGEFVNFTQESFLTEKAYKLQKDLQKNALNGSYKTKDGEEKLLTEEKINFLVNKINDLVAKKIDKLSAKTQDGQAYIDSLEFAAMLYYKFGVIIPPILLEGRMIQIRPVSMKTSAIAISHNTFINMLNIYKDKIIFYGNKDHCLIFTDKNGMKLNLKQKMFKNVEFEVLADAKLSNGFTSKQILRIIFIATHKQYGDAGVKALIKVLSMYGVECQAEYIERAFLGNLDDNNDLDRLSISSILNAKESGYYNNLILQINKAITLESKSFIKSTSNQIGHACIDNIDRCRLPLNAENRRMVADPTFIITGGRLNGILSIEDCFVSNPMRKTIAFFKYPIQGNEEYYIFENTSLKTIKKILNKHTKDNIITKEMADDIYNFYTNISDKVIVLPAFSHITFTCAGSDFDYDGSLTIYNVNKLKTNKDIISNEIVSLLKDNFNHQGVHLGDYINIK